MPSNKYDIVMISAVAAERSLSFPSLVGERCCDGSQIKNGALIP
jgi:hypothetical protein